MDGTESGRMPFEPADGVKARWRYAYELVVSKRPGDEITLAELAEALGVEYNSADRDQRRLLFGVMDTAREHLESEGRCTIRTVERFGWIVLDAIGALRQAEGRTRKVFSAVRRAARGLQAVRRDELPATHRNTHDFLSAQLLRAADIGQRRRVDVDALERASTRKDVPLQGERPSFGQ